MQMVIYNVVRVLRQTCCHPQSPIESLTSRTTTQPPIDVERGKEHGRARASNCIVNVILPAILQLIQRNETFKRPKCTVCNHFDGTRKQNKLHRQANERM